MNNIRHIIASLLCTKYEFDFSIQYINAKFSTSDQWVAKGSELRLWTFDTVKVVSYIDRKVLY